MDITTDTDASSDSRTDSDGSNDMVYGCSRALDRCFRVGDWHPSDGAGIDALTVAVFPTGIGGRGADAVPPQPQTDTTND